MHYYHLPGWLPWELQIAWFLSPVIHLYRQFLLAFGSGRQTTIGSIRCSHSSQNYDIYQNLASGTVADACN